MQSNKRVPYSDVSSMINLAFTTYWAERLSQLFWKKSGTLQRYTNFLLCETDPLFDQQRIAAQIIQIDTETDEATTLWLRPSSRWSGFKAGQFISIDCEINGVRLKRNYSLSCSPAYFQQHGLISITVKAINDGKVSNFLNQSMVESQVIHISEAMGSFTFEPEHQQSQSKAPLFVAAGSGITPIKSMIEHYIDQVTSQQVTAQPAQLIYYSNTKEDGIFISQLQQLAEQYDFLTVIHRTVDQDGLVSSSQLKDDCPAINEKAIYLCGPDGFMTSVQTICQSLNIDSDSILTESFGSAASLAMQSNAALNHDYQENPITVEFAYADKQVTSSQAKTLLELAENAGLTPKYGCRSGICHECKCQRPKGLLVNQMTGEAIPEDQTVVQSCITTPTGNITLEQW